MVTAMKSQDLFAYQDLISRATKDIHDRCDVDLSILWDQGKLEPVAGTHTVKVWNGLGSVDFQIEHDDLAQHGTAYRLFLEKVVSAVKRKLTLKI